MAWVNPNNRDPFWGTDKQTRQDLIKLAIQTGNQKVLDTIKKEERAEIQKNMLGAGTSTTTVGNTTTAGTQTKTGGTGTTNPYGGGSGGGTGSTKSWGGQTPAASTPESFYAQNNAASRARRKKTVKPEGYITPPRPWADTDEWIAYYRESEEQKAKGKTPGSEVITPPRPWADNDEWIAYHKQIEKQKAEQARAKKSKLKLVANPLAPVSNTPAYTDIMGWEEKAQTLGSKLGTNDVSEPTGEKYKAAEVWSYGGFTGGPQDLAVISALGIEPEDYLATAPAGGVKIATKEGTKPMFLPKWVIEDTDYEETTADKLPLLLQNAYLGFSEASADFTNGLDKMGLHLFPDEMSERANRRIDQFGERVNTRNAAQGKAAQIGGELLQGFGQAAPDAAAFLLPEAALPKATTLALRISDLAGLSAVLFPQHYGNAYDEAKANGFSEADRRDYALRSAINGTLLDSLLAMGVAQGMGAVGKVLEKAFGQAVPKSSLSNAVEEGVEAGIAKNGKGLYNEEVKNYEYFITDISNVKELEEKGVVIQKVINNDEAIVKYKRPNIMGIKNHYLDNLYNKADRSNLTIEKAQSFIDDAKIIIYQKKTHTIKFITKDGYTVINLDNELVTVVPQKWRNKYNQFLEEE